MKSKEDRLVREALKRHDPARQGGRVSDVDRARMRQAVVQAVPDRPGTLRLFPLTAGAGLALAALALVVAFRVMTRPAPAPTPPPPGASATPRQARPPSGPVQARQIQMTTPGGTRIVWILTS